MYKSIINHSNRTIYFDRKTESVCTTILNNITLKKLNKIDFDAHLKNISIYGYRPNQYNEIIEGIVPIPPKSKWHYHYGKFIPIKTILANKKADRTNFDSKLKRYIPIIKKKKIAVELSGGLDTSIIITYLTKILRLNIDLVGSSSKRYEFRTESYIQDILAELGNTVVLIDYEKVKPYSNLSYTPIHELPSTTSLFHEQAGITKNECLKLSIDLLLSGSGLDALLCNKPQIINNGEMPIDIIPSNMDDNWFNDYIYTPNKITYTTPAIIPTVIQNIWSIRNKLANFEDSQKQWARGFYKDILPRELVEYQYKADNASYLLSGLLENEELIKNMFKVVYNVLHKEEFSASSFEKLFINARDMHSKDTKMQLASISLVNWIYGLIRDEKIK